jgi:uracil-DNA glycosylase
MEQKFPLPNLGSCWNEVLLSTFQKPYMVELAAFVKSERTQEISVYPPRELVFNAFTKTAYDKVKVVIMGQDPYHGPGQAHGLSFSVPQNIPLPPSLKNIFKELATDLEVPMPSHGCLNHWAEQGVLLLNATLTVREGTPMSHHGRGWETFTDEVINVLCKRKDPIIFVLWGKSAQEKGRHLKTFGNEHIVLTAPHPSPFSAHQGFFGCRHFSQINAILSKLGNDEIDWKI